MFFCGFFFGKTNPLEKSLVLQFFFLIISHALWLQMLLYNIREFVQAGLTLAKNGPWDQLAVFRFFFYFLALFFWHFRARLSQFDFKKYKNSRIL